MSLWIALQQPHDRGVGLGALDELLEAELAVHVLVHLAEDLVGPLLRRAFVLRHFHDGAYHFIDSGDDLQHLLARDEAVAVEVVHGEGPLELLLELASRCHAQGAQKFPEINAPVAVRVKRPKHVLGKLGGIAIREEIAVDLLELLDRQLAIGTILEEALVPLVDLGIAKLGVGAQIVQDLRLELAIMLPHDSHRLEVNFYLQIF